MKKIVIKITMEDDSIREFEYDITPNNLLEVIPLLIHDFSELIESTPDELVNYMELGLSLAEQSIH